MPGFVVRAAARQKPGQDLPPSAHQLSRLHNQLMLLRAEVASGLAEHIAARDDRERLSTLKEVLRFNNLKIAASEQARRTCQEATDVCGIVGLRNASPFSVGRHLRDAMSGVLVVANERLDRTNATLPMFAKDV